MFRTCMYRPKSVTNGKFKFGEDPMRHLEIATEVRSAGGNGNGGGNGGGEWKRVRSAGKDAGREPKVNSSIVYQQTHTHMANLAEIGATIDAQIACS